MKTVLTFFFFWISLQVWAQNKPAFTARAEFPVRNLNSEYQAFPLPDSSVLVINHESFFRYATEKYTFYKLNPDLSTAWQLPAELPKGTTFQLAAFEKNTAYLLFSTFRNSEWMLVRLDLSGFHFLPSNHLLPPELSFSASQMKVLHGNLFITGQQNDRLILLHLDPQQDKFTQLPAIYEQASALTEFHTDKAAKRAEFILSETNGRKVRLQVKRLTPDGILRSLNFIQGQREGNFLAGRLSAGDSVQKMVFGTYSQRDLRYAQGFFATPLLQLPGQTIKYYDFTRFDHYFDYLNPKRQSRLRRRISQLAETRKTYKLRKRIMLHELTPYGSGSLLVGELYLPRYQGTASQVRVFDGYDYEQTLICAFAPNGDLLWENSFPLNGIHYFELQETVTVGIWGEKVMLCYPKEDEIYFKVLSGPEAVSNSNFIATAMAVPTEKLQSNQTEAVKFWYRQHFLVVGTQQVRGSGGSRHVFRIDKLTF